MNGLEMRHCVCVCVNNYFCKTYNFVAHRRVNMSTRNRHRHVLDKRIYSTSVNVRTYMLYQISAIIKTAFGTAHTKVNKVVYIPPPRYTGVGGKRMNECRKLEVIQRWPEICRV